MAGKAETLRGLRSSLRVCGVAMDAAEVEFLAEKELVTIIPNFSLDKIYLIGVSASGRRLPGEAGRGAWLSGSGPRGSAAAALISGR